jgi:hypothetical protein
MLSVSQLAPGRKVEVVAEMVMPLALQGDRHFLRLPLTVGEIYGHSPFLPADDIAVDPNLRLEGRLSISKASGRAVFASGDPADGDTVIGLEKSLELFFPDQRSGPDKTATVAILAPLTRQLTDSLFSRAGSS